LHGLITYIKGDYELAQKWYGATGTYYECFMYPSNLYKEYDIKPRAHDTINIQVGNSADPTNNHIEVFEKLAIYKHKNIKVYVPLSYGGNPEYAQKIISVGNDMFGDKFIAMTDFMSFDNYLDFLADIDIAVFNHNRQQAMGNAITLLGLGKKVYIRNDVTPWEMFEERGIKVLDVANIELSELDQATKQQNMEKVKEQFSKKYLIKQLETVFQVI
jgi:dTDP-N-acetylfucosamine:lipid II N-acetylfucosaminyltransferase